MEPRKLLQLQPTPEAHRMWKTVAAHRGVTMIQLFEDVARELYRGISINGQPDPVEGHSANEQTTILDPTPNPRPRHNSGVGTSKEREDISSS